MDVHVLYMRKTAFLRLVKVKLGPKFCFALGSRLKAHRFPPGLCPTAVPSGALLSPIDPLKPGPPATKIQLRPCLRQGG